MSHDPGPRDPHFADEALAIATTQREAVFSDEPLACPSCGVELTGTAAFETYRVCPNCHRHFPIPARERLRLLVDEASFRETNAALVSLDPLVFRDLLPVPDRLVEAAERYGGGPSGGVSEAVLTGTGTIGGREATLVVLDHAFLGASIGPVAGEKILLAMDAAASRRVPLIALCSAGGARTQEGLLGLIQAPKIAAAAARLHRAGVPFVSVLAHPATGAVWAALANQADIILAEPGARIGPASRQINDAPDTAEMLLARGMLDGIVDRTSLRETLAMLLGLLADRGEYRPATGDAPSAVPVRFLTGEPLAARRVAGWQEAGLARHAERPGSRDYLARLVTEWIELHGDRAGEDDSAIVTGMGRIAGIPAAIIAGERGRPARAGAFRKVERILRLAGHLEMPVVTLVDTPGLDTGPDCDAAQTAAAVAGVIGLTALLPVPMVSVVIGEAAGAAGRAAREKDLWDHTRRVVWQAPRRAVVRWAALLHDAGKPATRSVDAEGDVHFFGHERVGASLADRLLSRLNADRHLRASVRALVELHSRPAAYDASWTDSAVRRLALEAGPIWDDLLDLAAADVTSGRERKQIEAARRVTALRDHFGRLQAETALAQLDSPLDGNDLMRLFDRPPGPWIKRIKEHLRELVIDGALAPDDRDGAAALAAALVAGEAASDDRPSRMANEAERRITRR